MRNGRRRVILAAISAVLLAPSVAEAALSGPPGTSSSKVLVIGTDGTRIDLVKHEMDAGRAPNFAAIAHEGFMMPSLLAYQPPEALTISEVGWSTIATGVWPAKHGVRGYFLNMDPGQATKNGYLDFLSRIEKTRPSLSTFVAADWPNIADHANGGPIFGDAIDTRLTFAPEGTAESWDAFDQQVADGAARYLREGDPDAGFVYLGVVDETAHTDGSATERYLQAIRDTDRRIGQLLAAIRARPTYLAERWLVILTTDHGQQNLSFGIIASHGGPSQLERTSFVAATGFGLDSVGSRQLQVVDVAPTVLARLGIPVDPAWNLDGKAFSAEPAAPPPTATARRLHSHTLSIVVNAQPGAPALGSVRITLRGGRRISRKARGRRRLHLYVQSKRRSFPLKRITIRVTDVTGHRTTLRPRVAS
jgi:Type I phosphodiesterase / nucleotide pyrophosphatase